MLLNFWLFQKTELARLYIDAMIRETIMLVSILEMLRRNMYVVHTKMVSVLFAGALKIWSYY